MSVTVGNRIIIQGSQLNLTGGPYGGMIGIDATADTIYVSNTDNDNVVALSSNGTFIQTLLSGSKPFGLTIDDTGSNIFVSLFMDGTISKISTAFPYTLSTFCTVPGGGNWFVTYINGFLYIVSTFRNCITVVNNIGTVTGTYFINTDNSTFTNPVGITYYGKNLYLGYFGSGENGAGGVLQIPFEPTTGDVFINYKTSLLTNLKVPSELEIYNDVLVITSSPNSQVLFYKLGSNNFSLSYLDFSTVFYPGLLLIPTGLKVYNNLLYITSISEIYKLDMTPPVVSSVTISGSDVILTGLNLSYVISILFGTTPSTFTIVDSSTITTTIPEGNTDTTLYLSDGITTISKALGITRIEPTLGTFTIASLRFGSDPFTPTNPSSNSNGNFSYTSSNSAVATSNGTQIQIVGLGTTTITATQAAYGNYSEKSTTAQFTVTASPPPISPVPGITATICFPAGSRVKTDQGYIEIQKLIAGTHTLKGKDILAITETYSMDEHLVMIEKDAFRNKYPNKNTFISKRHKIYYKGQMKTAQRFVGRPGIYLVPYEGELLYNVLLKEYGVMSVNGLICETLNPINPISKFFM